MFPLGSVLFPHMPLPLRLFEPRYLKMLGQLLEAQAPEFGVVLIERGPEVGGGDQRFGIGTMARIVQVDAREDFIALLAMGTSRFRVTRWLADDPYPQAQVEALPELQWEDQLRPARERAEALVRRALAMTRELPGPVLDYPLATDPLAAVWQLAGLAPVAEMDHLRLLGVRSASELLDLIEQLVSESIETMSFGG